MRRTSTYLQIAIIVAFVGCRTTVRNEPPGAPGTTAGAGASSTGVSGRAAIDSTMKSHAERGRAIRNAVIRGDLGTAKAQAALLAHLRFQPGNDDWNGKAEGMNAAAASITQATDVAATAQSLASLATACGDCHAAHEGPSPPPSELVANDGGARSVMLRHEWAAARLWDGLATPSDAAWAEGAGILADSSLKPELLTPGKTPVPEVGKRAEEVRSFGLKAQQAATVEARRAVYAQTLASCAHCHEWLGGGPGAK